MQDMSYVSRVHKMEDKAEDESVVFREFTKTHRENEEKYIFLLEGIDDLDYYIRSFEKYIGDHKSDWIELVCHGRSNVINLINTLKKHSRTEYKNSLHFGFIDKDYHEINENPCPEKIYITPVYSIENFYASLDFMKKILERKFHLKENDKDNNDFSVCLDNFLSRRDEFLDGIKELDSLLRCNRLMYEEEKIESKINVRDITLFNHVTIDINKVIFQTHALDILKKSYDDFDADCLEISRNFYKEKTSEELASLVRGKFMFYFIHHYLHKLKEDNLKAIPFLFVDSYANSKLRRPQKKPFNKTKITLTKEKQDILSDYSSLSDLPDCLITFIANINKNKEGDNKILLAI